MMENILEKNEKIKFQEDVDFYPGKGVKAALKTKEGVAAITDKRFLIARRSSLSTIITIIVAVVIVFPVVFMMDIGVIEAAIIGGLVGGLVHFILPKFINIKGKIQDTATVSIPLKDIENVEIEEATKNTSVVIITSKDNETWSIHSKSADKWKELSKK